MGKYLKYNKKNEFTFEIDESSFITFLSNESRKLIDTLACLKLSPYLFIDGKKANSLKNEDVRKNISYVLNKDISIFTSESVEDEIAYSLESLGVSKYEMREKILLKSREFHLEDLLLMSPDSLGSSDKTKLKILSSIIFEPKVLVLDNVLAELDNDDRERVVRLLKEYVSAGNIVINFTEDVEESLYGDRIIITDGEKIIADGKTLSVLNEDKLLKKLGIGLPFIVEINKYLIDYGIIKNYEFDMRKLVDKIWK